MALGDRLVRFARGKTVEAGEPRALLGRGDRVVVAGVISAPAAGESQVVRWFTLDEALAIADAGLVDGLRRLQGGLHQLPD